jgi:hypothetical protein
MRAKAKADRQAALPGAGGGKAIGKMCHVLKMEVGFPGKGTSISIMEVLVPGKRCAISIFEVP